MGDFVNSYRSDFHIGFWQQPHQCVLPLKSLSCIRLWGPTFLIFLRRLNQRTLTWTDHPSAAKASASFSTLPLKGRRVARGKARSKRPSSIRHLTAAEILLRIINALW